MLPAALQQLPQLPQWTGLVVQIVPGDVTIPVVVELAPDVAGVPGTWAQVDNLIIRSRSGSPVSIPLPIVSTESWWIRARHEGPGYAAGPNTTTARAYKAVSVSSLGLQAILSTIYPIDRVLPLTDGFYTPKADNATGTILSEGTRQNDGAGARIPVKGRQSGSCRHTTAVTFGTAFQNPPRVILRSGILFEPRSKWGATGSGSETGAPNAALPQLEDLVALNVTASGFTARGRLRQKGTATLRTHNFTAANNLTTAGQTTAVTLSNAPSTTDLYTVKFQVELNLRSKTFALVEMNVTVLVEVSADAGANWTTVETFSYSIEDNTNTLQTDTYQETSAVTYSGLDSTDQVRLKLSAVTLTGGLALTATVSVKGYDGTIGSPAVGVSYYSASDSFASKTPDADDLLFWEAEDVTG